VSGSILVHRHQCRHATALFEHLAHAVAGSLGRDHADVDIRRRNYLPEPDIESVREHQRLAGTEVRLDIIAVEPRLTGVGSEDHDDPRLRCRIAYTGDGESRGARGLTTPRVFTQADDDVDSAVSQV